MLLRHSLNHPSWQVSWGQFLQLGDFAHINSCCGQELLNKDSCTTPLLNLPALLPRDPHPYRKLTLVRI